MSCSLVFQNAYAGPIAVANIVNFDDVAKTIDSTGTLGDLVKAKILRRGVVIEQTTYVPNTGNNQLPYTSNLQNGDQLCVVATYIGGGENEDCGFIPTPGLGFVPIS